MPTATETIRDKCNQAKTIINNCLKGNAKLEEEVAAWRRQSSDKMVSINLLVRVKQVLAELEALGGKIDVIEDNACMLRDKGKEQEAKL